MIRPTLYGHELSIVRHNGALRTIPVYRWRESAAFRTILAYWRADLLTHHEAGLLLCGLNQLTEPRASRQSAPRNSAWVVPKSWRGRLARLAEFFRWLCGACEMGGNGE